MMALSLKDICIKQPLDVNVQSFREITQGIVVVEHGNKIAFGLKKAFFIFF